MKCGNAVFLRDLRSRVLVAADQRGDFHTGNSFQRVEMFLTERALTGDANLHYFFLDFLAFFFDPLSLFSRMMCPTAVLEAGTV